MAIRGFRHDAHCILVPSRPTSGESSQSNSVATRQPYQLDARIAQAPRGAAPPWAPFFRCAYSSVPHQPAIFRGGGSLSCRALVAFRCLRRLRLVTNQCLMLRQISALATRILGIFGAKCLILFGWGTWIRTRTNGVRVRGSTVNLFPSRADRRPEARVSDRAFYMRSPISQARIE